MRPNAGLFYCYWASAPAAMPGPDRPGREGQHQQRVAEAAVFDHVRHRVGGSEAEPQGVEVRQGAERGTGQQGRTAMSGRGDGSSTPGAAQ